MTAGENAVVGKKIRSMRMWEDMTLDDLAKETGISKSTLSRIERGQGAQKLGQFDALAKVFNITREKLLDPTDPFGLEKGPYLRHKSQLTAQVA